MYLIHLFLNMINKHLLTLIWKAQAIIIVIGLFFLSPTSALAFIRNPAIPASLGSDIVGAKSGEVTTYYAAILWRASISVGMMLVLVYFIWGAIEWITANGDEGKIKTARNKMTGSVTGVVILAGSFSIIAIIGTILGLDLLNPVLPTP